MDLASQDPRGDLASKGGTGLITIKESSRDLSSACLSAWAAGLGRALLGGRSLCLGLPAACLPSVWSRFALARFVVFVLRSWHATVSLGRGRRVPRREPRPRPATLGGRVFPTLGLVVLGAPGGVGGLWNLRRV